jgi:hypothetical protein
MIGIRRSRTRSPGWMIRRFVLSIALLGLMFGTASAGPGWWNIGAGQGNLELIYGRFGDHEVIIGCDPRENHLSFWMGLVAPVAERRGPRQGVVIITLGGRELRISGQIGEGPVEVIIPGSEHESPRGQPMVRTREDSTRLLHSFGASRAEADSFIDMMSTRPGEPVIIRIEGEPRTYQLGPNARVRSARSIREACPRLPAVS